MHSHVTDESESLHVDHSSLRFANSSPMQDYALSTRANHYNGKNNMYALSYGHYKSSPSEIIYARNIDVQT